MRYNDDILAAADACGIDESEIDDCYEGYFDSRADFAMHMADMIGFEPQPQWPANCIDWDFAGRELMYDYCEHDGHYFRAV